MQQVVFGGLYTFSMAHPYLISGDVRRGLKAKADPLIQSPSNIELCESVLLSTEWNSIVTTTVHKTLPGSLFCLSKTGP